MRRLVLTVRCAVAVRRHIHRRLQGAAPLSAPLCATLCATGGCGVGRAPKHLRPLNAIHTRARVCECVSE